MSLLNAIKGLIKVHKAQKTYAKYKKVYDKVDKLKKEAAKKKYDIAKAFKKSDLNEDLTQIQAMSKRVQAANAIKFTLPENYTHELHKLYLAAHKKEGPTGTTTQNRYRDMVNAIPKDLTRFRELWMDARQSNQELASMIQDVGKAATVMQDIKKGFQWGAENLPKIGAIDLPGICVSLYMAAEKASRQINAQHSDLRTLLKAAAAAKDKVQGEMEYLTNMQKYVKANPVPPAGTPAPAR